jgi:hypothetical protein
MIDEDDLWSNWWSEDWQGKPKCSEKTCPSATLSTTKSHMTRPGFEPRTAAVGSQRLTAWAMARPCWQPYRHRWADCLENVGASTFHNPMGLYGLLQGQLYLFIFLISKSVSPSSPINTAIAARHFSHVKCLFICRGTNFVTNCSHFSPAEYIIKYTAQIFA